MERAMKTDPDWSEKALQSGMFDIFELKDTKKVESKPPPKEPAKLQVRPLVKPSDK